MNNGDVDDDDDDDAADDDADDDGAVKIVMVMVMHTIRRLGSQTPPAIEWYPLLLWFQMYRRRVWACSGRQSKGKQRSCHHTQRS